MVSSNSSSRLERFSGLQAGRIFGYPSRGQLGLVAQRGFPAGDVKVTKEIVDCGRGEDTVYRDKAKDVIARNCEHKKAGYPLE